MTRSLYLVVMCALLVMVGCAPKAAPPAPTAPRYPAFLYPGVPATLAVQTQLAARHNDAWQRLQSGDLRTAERDFKWITDQLSTFFPAQAGLGYVALARRDYRQALEHFELGLALAPNYPAGLAGRGEALLGLGRTAEAIVNFEAAVAADPSLTDLRARAEALRFRGMEEQIAAARKARDAGRYEDAATGYQRALAASPESGFLYRELASVEQRLGALDSALAHARKALELDAGDVRARIIAGEVLEAQRQLPAAVAEYEAAAALEPSEELTTRIEAVRERIALAELPAEYHAIESDPAITRAQLAALIGVRLEDLLHQASRRAAPVMTDTRGHWASPWINAVVRTGVMDPFPNHTFQPSAVVRRSDLAMAVSKLLGLAAPRVQKSVEKWRAGRPRFEDLPPTHLMYSAAALAVEAKVLQPVEGSTFQPGRVVSGSEAVEALTRIAALTEEEKSRP